MKPFLIFSILISGIYADEPKNNEGKDDAARIEILLRQQRELEADELILGAVKSKKEGNFEEAINGFRKAISLYLKSSLSEKRIINKVNNSRMNLLQCCKAYADQLIKQAEKESSVELFDKAKKFLNEAKSTADQIKRLR